ncbi:MAG: M28 family peptidase [Planctomycetes bacterium]|nr:M28 family peptidase [Planctomycetota bacterium]
MHVTPRPARLALAFATLCAALAAAHASPDPTHSPPQAALTPEIADDQILTRDAYLSSEELQGRESGTSGGAAAESYVDAELARLRLEPLGDAGTGFQTVRLPSRPVLAEQCSVEIRVEGYDPLTVEPKDGAVPFSGSKECDLAAGVVFAGYGLSSPENRYDDWAGIDARGKVAIVLRHGPREDDKTSPWYLRRGDKALMESMSFESKAKRAAAAGAVAVLFVNDQLHKDQGLPTSGGPDLAIPAFGVPRSAANRLLHGLGKELVDLENAIGKTLEPRSADVPGAAVTLRARLGSDTARNVLFVLRGTDPKLKDQAVVVSAHTDHVGFGWFGSVSNSGGQIHNGADDNASGTAALLEVAESLAAGPAMRRSVVFAGWCGEEKGLVGSEWWCAKPTWPLANVAANINLDMVGRYRDHGDDDSGLIVVGATTGTGFAEKVDAAAKAQSLRTTYSWEAWEQSDHFSLYQKKIPVLFLHTGLHPDYHRPADDWWKLEAKGAAKIARAASDIVRALADDDARPEFRTKPARAVLGVSLGDVDGEKGARLDQVFPGLAAASGGLQAGDVIVEADQKPIRSSGDLAKVLADHKPGDEIEVVFRRGGKDAKAKLKLSGR